MLTGEKIKELVNDNKIVIEPFNEDQLNPNSYNVRLHNVLKVYDTTDGILDLKKNNKVKEIVIPESGLILYPGKIYLGRTVEYTETPPIDENTGLVICLDGRSSTARLGILCHNTAGFGDIGFKGTFTFEISCIQPVKIYPNIEIGQIYYTTTVGKTNITYNGKYQGQISAGESKFFIDSDK